MTNWIGNALFPELTRFSTQDERRAAWQVAVRRVEKRWQYWLIVTLIVVADIVLTFSVPRLGVPMAHRGTVRGAMTVAAMAACCTAFLFFRRHILRVLREDLAARGIPVCVACGYNLTGNVSGRCDVGSLRLPTRTAARSAAPGSPITRISSAYDVMNRSLNRPDLLLVPAYRGFSAALPRCPPTGRAIRGGDVQRHRPLHRPIGEATQERR